MAKIESIRQHRHTLTFSDGDPDVTPVVVTLRRMTVDEWMDAQRLIADNAAQAYGEELKAQTDQLIQAALDGDKDEANSSADKLIDSIAHKGIRKLERDHEQKRDRLRDHIVSVDGLEGVESGGEVEELISFRPIMLELWEALDNASSLSESAKKV